MTIRISSLIISLALTLGAGNVFGQTLPVNNNQTTNQTSSNQGTTAVPLPVFRECLPTETRVAFSNWNVAGGQVLDICHVVGIQSSPRKMFDAPLVQQLIPFPGGGIYAVSNSGKLYRFSPGGLDYFNGVQYYNLKSWRAPGAGFATLLLGAAGLRYRYAWDSETYDVFLTEDTLTSRFVPEQQYNDVRRSCLPVVRTSDGVELCLSVGSGVVYRAGGNVFGPDWATAIKLFEGQQALNLVVRGDTAYVTFATSYEYPTNPPTVGPSVSSAVHPGKVLAVTFRGGGMVAKVLADGYDTGFAADQSRLAVSDKGVYFIATVVEGGKNHSNIYFRGFNSTTVELVVKGVEFDNFSALTVLP